MNGPEYLLRTVASLIDHTSPAEKLIVSVVVLLADLDVEYNNESAVEIQDRFADHFKSGFLRVVRVSDSYYPPLKGLKRNFGDASDRVSWRAKQAADFAFMFAYARNLSDYYIQIEDDVDSSHGFVAAVRKFIDERDEVDSHWAMLEFSELGFIGKLFHSGDLDRLSLYMRMFYSEQPVDWLIRYFRLSLGQRMLYLRKPTLFQHFGVKSSFDLTKDNLLKDR